jgi:hypothetical protein
MLYLPFTTLDQSMLLHLGFGFKCWIKSCVVWGEGVSHGSYQNLSQIFNAQFHSVQLSEQLFIRLGLYESMAEDW